VTLPLQTVQPMPWTRVPARRRSAPVLAVAIAAVAVVALVVGLLSLRATPSRPSVAPGDACGPAWVTGWHAAMQAGSPPRGVGGAATLRMIVRPQVTGAQVRLRLSNVYGTAPLTVAAVTVARSGGGAALVRGTAHPVTFGGRGGTVIPPGGEVLSDAVSAVADTGTPLAVTISVPWLPPVVSEHPVALQTSWLAPGAVLPDADGHAFGEPLTSWLVLGGVDVLAPRPVNAVVAVGDSITDGVGTALDADARWTDALATRLTTAGGGAAMAVLNAGMSGDELLAGTPVGGETPEARFDRDIAAAVGATDVVLNIGTNDIAAGRDAAAIEAGLVRFADRVRAAGKHVFLTTITPSEAGPRGTPSAVATREAVNAWLRAHGREHAAGVIDFAAAVADRAHPERLARTADAGDGLHLSAAGYRALAAAVPVRALTGSPCLADGATAAVALSGH
jgi:lysophospholipase L1-like esterase